MKILKLLRPSATLILRYSLSDGCSVLSSGRVDEFKVFFCVGVVFLGLPFLSSDVDLTVEGFFCFLLWLH